MTEHKTQNASIFDIEIPTATATIAGPSGEQNVQVQAISADALTSVVADQEVLRILFEDGADLADVGYDRLASLVAQVPEAVGSVIAAGVGAPGDEQHINRARQLPLDAQVELIRAILSATMPDGPGPFINRVLDAIGIADAPEETTDHAS